MIFRVSFNEDVVKLDVAMGNVLHDMEIIQSIANLSSQLDFLGTTQSLSFDASQERALLGMLKHKDIPSAFGDGSALHQSHSLFITNTCEEVRMIKSLHDAILVLEVPSVFVIFYVHHF